MKTLKKYYEPTPKAFRKLGDALLVTSTFLTTYSVADEWGKGITIAIVIVGAVGKFLTNLFSDTNQQDSV